MKAHILKEPETLLLYHLEADTLKGSTVRKIADELQISVLDAQESKLTQKLGQHLGAPGFPALSSEIDPESNSPFIEEVIIFRGMSREKIGEFLDKLRQNNVTINLKCTVTPTNLNWPLCRLFDELQREHFALNRSIVTG